MKKTLYILFLPVILLTGCSRTNSDKPPDIMPGKDPCDNCFMIISEDRFAASLWLENGEAKRFDDIGCMLSYVHKNKSSVRTYWVYDYLSNVPLKADNSFFLASDKLETPMGSGIIALKSRPEALRLAEKFQTNIISFYDLKNKHNKSIMEQ